MKKLFLATILLFSVMNFGQKRHGVVHTTGASVTADSTKTTTTKWSKYVAVGVSISNGNSYDTNTNLYTFQESAYPSVEFGFSRENLSLSGVIGRGNFQGLGSNIDGIGNYYWEAKVTPTFPLGVVNASLIFGAGTYFNNQVGIGFNDYCDGLDKYFEAVNPQRAGKGYGRSGLDQAKYDAMWENEFMYEIFTFMGGYDTPVGDLKRLNSYGLVKRDGEDTIVLIDYGITWDGFDTYYK